MRHARNVRILGLSVLLLTMVGVAAARGQLKTTTTTTTTATSDTTLVLSTGGIDEKIYLSAAAYSPVLFDRDPEQQRLPYELPVELVTITPFTLFGRGGPVSGIRTVYSNVPSGVDVGFFGAIGDRSVGISAKVQFLGARDTAIGEVRRVHQMAVTELRRLAASGKTNTDPDFLSATQRVRGVQDKAREATSESLTALRAAVYSSYAESGGLGLARIGLSASKLFPLGSDRAETPPPGLLLLGNVEAVDITTGFSGPRSAGQVGFGVALQDAYPANNKTARRIWRWRNQVGVECVLHSAIAPDDTVAAFWRLRIEKPVEKCKTMEEFIRNSWELGLFGGVDSARKAFGMVRISRSI